VLAAAAYALAAATTTPFTWAADVMTAIPIAAMVSLAVARWPARPQAMPPERRGRAGHPYRPWVVLAAAAVAWELTEYLSRGSRGQHPTLSSMADAVDRHYALKAVLFFGWLWLGAVIVRAGARARPGAGSAMEAP
jgi:hypothetical protein